jgi:hypothetical protein
MTVTSIVVCESCYIYEFRGYALIYFSRSSLVLPLEFCSWSHVSRSEFFVSAWICLGLILCCRSRPVGSLRCPVFSPAGRSWFLFLLRSVAAGLDVPAAIILHPLSILVPWSLSSLEVSDSCHQHGGPLRFPTRKRGLHFMHACDFAAVIQGSFLLVLRSGSSIGQRTSSPRPVDLVRPTSFLAPGFHFALPFFATPMDFCLFWWLSAWIALHSSESSRNQFVLQDLAFCSCVVRLVADFARAWEVFGEMCVRMWEALLVWFVLLLWFQFPNPVSTGNSFSIAMWSWPS